MCGIAGIRRFGEEPITATQIKTLLLKIEHRGGDATGIAVQHNDKPEVHVLKDDEIAWKFIESQEFEKFLKEHVTDTLQTVLLHTRLATQGSPLQNENNHPVFAGNTAVVHNGCINNDDHLFKHTKFTRKAEVDTDILRAILDAEGFSKASIKKLSDVSGSVAIAAISAAHPGKLILGRCGSPLVMCKTGGGLLLWASEKVALHQAVRGWEKWKDLWFQQNRTDIMFQPVANDTIYLIGQDGVEAREEFKTSHYYTAPKYQVYENYWSQQDKWARRGFLSKRRQDSDFTICPNEKCGNWVDLTNDKDEPLSNLRCAACDTHLDGSDLETAAV